MFRCYIHKYKTINPYKFDEHCYKTKHRIIGFKNGKKFNKRYPKNNMLKDLGYEGMNYLYLRLYMESKNKRNVKKK